MGNLTGILVVEDFEQEEKIKDQVRQDFGLIWEQVVLGAERPFSYHIYYDVFLRVSNIRFKDAGTLLSLLSKPGFDTCNIIIG